MTHQELAYFKDLILKKRAELLKDLGQIEEQSMNATSSESSGGSSYSDHMPDLGSDAIEREKAFMFASRDGAYLTHLDKALERIEDGTFGVCRGCGGEISKERLEAVPNATMCVVCKSEEDRKKRRA
jgi:RNA polymerase-binding protein DksA